MQLEEVTQEVDDLGNRLAAEELLDLLAEAGHPLVFAHRLAQVKALAEKANDGAVASAVANRAGGVNPAALELGALDQLVNQSRLAGALVAEDTDQLWRREVDRGVDDLEESAQLGAATD